MLMESHHFYLCGALREKLLGPLDASANVKHGRRSLPALGAHDEDVLGRCIEFPLRGLGDLGTESHVANGSVRLSER